MTDWDLEKFKSEMVKEKKPIMYNRVLSTLSHMYTRAIEWHKVESVPFTVSGKRIKEKSRLRYLTPDEVERLVEACPKQLKPIVLTALHTGMRKNEVLTLQLKQNVDLENRIITLTQTKTDETRHIPINETLFAVLQKQAEGKNPGDYLFTGTGDKPFQSVKKSFATALKKAEIEDFTFHDLRHTFASNLVMNDVNLYVVKELLGHKDIKMTMKYAHLSPDHQANAIYKLDNIYGNKRGSSGKELEVVGNV